MNYGHTLSNILCLPALLILFIPVISFSQENTPGDGILTLEAALQQGLAENPGLLALRQRYEAASHQIPQATALPDPRLQATHFVESVQTRTGPQKNVLTLNQGIPWPGTLKHRGEQASAQAEALWYAYHASQLQLVRAISEAYFDYAYQNKAIDITDENIRLLNELLPIVEEKVRVGGDLSSLLRLKIEVGQVQDRRERLFENKARIEASLRQLLATGTVSAPELHEPILRDWDKGALLVQMEAGNPDLQMAELKIRSALAARELARLKAMPELSIGINYIQTGEAVIPSVSGSGKDPWGVAFSMTMPLNFGKNRAVRAEAASRIKANEAERLNTLNSLTSQLESSLIHYRDAGRRYRLYNNELIPLARQAWEISQTSYENGKAGILEVIENERSLLELQLEYWRAASDIWKRQLEISTLTDASGFNNLTNQSYEN